MPFDRLTTISATRRRRSHYLLHLRHFDDAFRFSKQKSPPTLHVTHSHDAIFGGISVLARTMVFLIFFLILC